MCVCVYVCACVPEFVYTDGRTLVNVSVIRKVRHTPDIASVIRKVRHTPDIASVIRKVRHTPDIASVPETVDKTRRAR